MTSARVGFGAASAGLPYQARGANFDGTNDWIEETGLSTSSSTRFVVSAWARLTGGDATIRYLSQITGTRMYAYAHSTNVYRIGVRNAANATLAEWRFTTSIAADTTWHHIFVYFDGLTPANTFGFFDGVAQGADTTGGTGTFNTDQVTWAVGAATGGSSKFPGDIAELWMGDPGRTVTAADVTKFISGGRPRWLGHTGAGPFGAQPLFYFRGGFGAFGTNSGSAGNLAVTGALTAPARLYKAGA